MTRNKIFLLISMLFLILHKAQSQKKCDCFLQGKVVDFSTNEPLVGVIISIPKINKTAVSGADGSYKISNICEGGYEIIGKIIGYSTFQTTVELTHELHQDLALKEDEIHLEEVMIKVEKNEFFQHQTKALNNADLVSSSGENLGNLLTKITGVQVLQTGNSIAKPMIHGLHSSRLVILTNDIRLESQQWGSEHAPEIDPMAANKITLIKGAAGVRYGADAIAGVIKIEPASLFSVRNSTVFSQSYFTNGNQFSSSLRREGTVKKSFFYRVNGTYKRGGNISTPNYRLANTGVSELNFALAAGYKAKKMEHELYFSQFNSQIGIFSGSHIGNTTDLLDAITRKQPLEQYTPPQFSYFIDKPYQDLQHNLAKYKFVKPLKNGQQLTLNAGRQFNFRREVDVLRGSRTASQTFLLTSYSLETLFEHRLAKSISGSIGVHFLRQQNISTGKLQTPQKTSVIIPNYAQENIAFFAFERWVRNKVDWEIGVRAEQRNQSIYRFLPNRTIQNDKIRNSNLVAATGFTYHFLEKSTFGFKYSSNWRPASINELYSDGVHHGSASYEIGDGTLQPEYANNLNFMVDMELNKFNFSLNAYIHSISNFIFLAPTGQTVLSIRGAFPEFRYTQTKALLQGFDLDASYHFTQKFHADLSFSFLQADDVSSKQPLIFMPANRISIKVEYLPKFRFLSLIYLKNNIISRQNRVPTRLIFENEDEINTLFLSFAGDFLPPPSGYHLLNFGVEGNVFQKEKKGLLYSLEIKNLLNTSYRDYLNRFRYFADEIGRNFQLRLTYSF